VNDAFRKIAHHVSLVVGSPAVFLLALAVVIVWLVSGPFFGFSDTWQLVINTGTTIVTFLMVFLIQNTQNRDTRAIHLKLDELIIYTKGADNELVDLENLTDEQVDRLEKQYHALAKALGKDGVPHSPEDHDDSGAHPEEAESTPRREPAQ
jgi:low affinity Fe/Cu permease